MRCYIYAKCSTCRDALRWLEGQGIAVEVLPIRDTPPNPHELAYALQELGDMRKFLNTSGMDYRAMGLKETVDGMSATEVFGLIQKNGNLCKRPFLIDQSKGVMLCGFRPEQWQMKLLNR
jgi:arsenate reductase (glutaredoxin)